MRIRRTFLILTGLVLVPPLVALVVFAWLWWVTPDPAALRKVNPQTTSFIQRHCQTDDCSIKWVSLRDMSPFVPQAVVLAEDIRFFFHGGIDWVSVWAALKTNLRQHRIVWGGSTITQQLAKNIYLGREKTIGRKIREVILTFKLERSLPKERILELYLNVAQWGPSLYGVGNAASHYFGKTPDQIGPLEASFLASILPNPEQADKGALRERFVEAGSQIFAFLVRSYLPPIQEETISQSCDTRLTSEEADRTDYLVAKIFGEWANGIISGEASLADTKDLDKILSPDEGAFLKDLVDRARKIRPIRPVACRRLTSGDPQREFELLRQPSATYGERIFFIPKAAHEGVINLIKRSRIEGIPLVITSAYRGSGYQLYVFLATLRQMAYCLSFTVKKVALPEESEHECLDTPALDFGALDSREIPFAQTDAYRWMLREAPSAGFVLSYPEDNPHGIGFEPWHWRWEGTGQGIRR